MKNKDPLRWYVPPYVHFYPGLLVIFLVSSSVSWVLLPLISKIRAAEIDQLYKAALASAALGIFILFLARLPLYRERKFLTFGPRELDRPHRFLYWLAYLCVAAALLLFSIVWIRTP